MTNKHQIQLPHKISWRTDIKPKELYTLAKISPVTFRANYRQIVEALVDYLPEYFYLPEKKEKNNL